jgi:hypothetical protein
VKSFASEGEVFAVKILVLAIVSVILAVSGSLLARELHRWIDRKKLKHLALGLILVGVLAVLIFSAEAVFQQSKIVVHFFMPVAIATLAVYESERTERAEKIFTMSCLCFWHELLELTKEEQLLPLLCALLPAGSWAISYYRNCFWCGQMATTFVGLALGVALLMIGVWRFMKRDNP